MLIIGNGFDIAHNLPTKYTDFLDFISGERYTQSKAYMCKFVGQDAVDTEYLDVIRENTLRLIGDGNGLIDIFDTGLKRERLKGEDWVDFEQEIARVVLSIEKEVINGSGEKGGLVEEYAKSDYPTDIAEIILRLHIDFNRLLCAFEYYIEAIVNRIEVDCCCCELKGINPDIIISLNYSNTYERHYRKYSDIDYIHGKADFSYRKCKEKLLNGFTKKKEEYEFFRDHNHIVLGMDEETDDFVMEEHPECIEFRKYFQRISKRTGSKYKKHLDADSLRVYVFGHSLDTTDEEIIRDVIGHKNAITTVFYHNENAHIKEITNLIRIFRRERVTEKCDGDNPSIVFVQQQKPLMIHDCSFVFARAVSHLKHFGKLSKSEFDRYYDDLAVMLNNSDIKQNDILEAYYALCELGIEDQLEESLLKRATEVPAINGSNDCVNAMWFDRNEWMECDPIEGGYVPAKMERFIIKVNDFNRNRYTYEGERLIETHKEYIHDYEREIPSEIEQKCYRSFINKMIKQLERTDDSERVWNLLKKVTISDANIGAQVELDGLQKSDDIFTRVVANVLLEYMTDCEREKEYYESIRTDNM